jgi:hypothetical protein
MVIVLMSVLAGCGQPRPFRHDFGDVSAADRIEVTVEGVTPVRTVTDPQRVAAVAAFIKRRQDGWINVWSGAGGMRYVTFYANNRPLKGFGMSTAGISDGDYARPLSNAETAELASLLQIEWPPATAPPSR